MNCGHSLGSDILLVQASVKQNLSYVVARGISLLHLDHCLPLLGLFSLQRLRGAEREGERRDENLDDLSLSLPPPLEILQIMDQSHQYLEQGWNNENE